MPFKTIAIVGLAGAAAGAAATTAYFTSSRAERMSASDASSTFPSVSPASTRSAAASGGAAASAVPVFAPVAVEQQQQQQQQQQPLPPYMAPVSPNGQLQQPLPPYPPPVNPNGLFQYGFPGPVADVRHAPSLTSAFDRRTRNPHWVAEHITPASLAVSGGDRRHSVFVEDEGIPEMFRAKLKDYFRSGYDRGHQVPAADAKWSQDAMNATFALSNMCPQVGDGFNRDYWAHFEDFCRRLTKSYPSVRIVTGPLYLPRREMDGKWRVSYEVIGSPPNVAVPTHFYKVIYAEDGRAGGNVSLAAFVLPNAEIANNKPLVDFEVPLAVVERASGLDFASKLPAQRRKRLCTEIDCSVIVKEYADRQKSFGSSTGPPAPKPLPPRL